MAQAVIDYYAVLQVAFGAEKSDIVSSYKRLCKLYHPDINPDPAAEEIMKEINRAYYILCDDIRREAYNNIYIPGNVGAACSAARDFSARRQREAVKKERSYDNEKAAAVMGKYFNSLLDGDFHTAYDLLSDHDHQYVTIQSFIGWRESVSKLYSIRSFTMTLSDPNTIVRLDNSISAKAKKFSLSVTEKNLVNQTFCKYQTAKYAVYENNSWSIFLGYRDLNEIANMFQELSREQEQGEMEKLWQSYCLNHCRELDMLSRAGFIDSSAREIYRYKRYKQPITAALFSIKPAMDAAGEADSLTILEWAAAALRMHLREIDLVAYLGDGVFAVLFVELKKRFCQAIVSRTADFIQSKLEERNVTKSAVRFCYDMYNGGSMDDLLNKLEQNL